MCLNIAPAQNRTPTSIVYDEYAEEMSFPGIYGGHPRKYRKGVRVTPYHKATSETRRRDRRGAKPTHILYMAVKIMRLRAHEGVTNYFRVQGEERSQEFSQAAKYGDICAAKVVVMGTEILLVSVYISPGTTTTQKLWFLSRHLGPVAELDTPMVVTGDFNLDVSKQDSSRFVEFMANHFKLRLSNDVKKTTTLGGSVLDLTFTKNIEAETTRYASYFSYHRPMLSVIRPTTSNSSQSS
ncbi:hypothetical protein pipiens_000176, partial [Culex pipiens pipiens]